MDAKKSFGDEFVAHELTKEAWTSLSREFKWTEDLLKKYRGEIDWEALSRNTDMLWTASILENFKSYIDWKTLSGYADENLLTPKIIERFADRWDWYELSQNWRINFSYDFIDKYVEKLRDSSLWSSLVAKRVKELEQQIVG